MLAGGRWVSDERDDERWRERSIYNRTRDEPSTREENEYERTDEEKLEFVRAVAGHHGGARELSRENLFWRIDL